MTHIFSRCMFLKDSFRTLIILIKSFSLHTPCSVVRHLCVYMSICLVLNDKFWALKSALLLCLSVNSNLKTKTGYIPLLESEHEFWRTHTRLSKLKKKSPLVFASILSNFLNKCALVFGLHVSKSVWGVRSMGTGITVISRHVVLGTEPSERAAGTLSCWAVSSPTSIFLNPSVLTASVKWE